MFCFSLDEPFWITLENFMLFLVGISYFICHINRRCSTIIFLIIITYNECMDAEFDQLAQFQSNITFYIHE